MKAIHINEKKNAVIKLIFEHLKPNTYSENHDIWLRTRLRLHSISLKGLQDLYILILAKGENECF